MDRELVGRTSEMAALERQLDRAFEGRGSLVVVGGEPGIGKTRLGEELVERAQHRGAVTAWGRCWEAGGAPPYWPWTEILRALGPQLGPGGIAGAVGDAAPLAPLLSDVAQSPSDGGHDEGRTRFRLYESFVTVLEAAALLAPVVVVLDDAHAADQSSLLLLQFLSGRVVTLPLLVLVTFRDVELSAGHPFVATLAGLLRQRGTTRLEMAGLEVDAVAELIAGTTGVAPRPSLAARVREQTDGNPLYVREVSRLLASDGRLEGDDLTLPHDVRETVLQRVALLPDRTRAALTMAAVLGRDFPVDVLVALTSPAVLEDLEPATTAHLIGSAGARVGRLRFSHAMVAQALYEDLPPGRRMQLHLAAAEALEQRHVADPDPVLSELAHHYCAAVPAVAAEVAASFASRAGARAVRLLAFEEGIRLYRLALTVLESGSTNDPTARLDLLLALGDAQARAGETDASKLTFLAAADLARSVDDGIRLARAAVGYGGRFVWLRPGRDVRLVPLLEEALDALPDGDSVVRSQVAARLSGALRDEPRRDRREALSAEALSMARRLGDRETLAAALAARFTAIWGPDTVEEERSLAEEILAVTAGGDPERAGDADWLIFIVSLTTGDADRARSHERHYRELVRAIRQPSQSWYSGVMRSILALITGPLDGLDELLEETRASGRTSQTSDADASYRLALLELRHQQGRLHEVEGEARAGLTEFPGYACFAAWDALVLAETGQVEAAGAQARRLAEGGEDVLPRDNGWLAAMVLIAHVALVVGDDDLARHQYEALRPYARLFALAHGEVLVGSVSLTLGRLTTRLGGLEAAEAFLDQALVLHQRMDAHVLVAQTFFAQAELFERRGGRGDAARATALFARAGSEARRLGMTGLQRRAQACIGGNTPRPGGLTPREQEVAVLVAGGASNRDIAEALVLSERTVETHVQNILLKLGFTSRTQVATWAVAQGLSVPAP